jgi:hypothetical protein
MTRTTIEIPQADVIWDVAQVAEAVVRGHTQAETIGQAIGAKGQRQGHYYIQAARSIGLVEIHEHNGAVQLTKFGLAFARYNRADQRAALRRQLMRYEPTRSVLAAMKQGDGLDKRGIAAVLRTLAPLAESTALRRASSVAAWLTELGLAQWQGMLLRYCGPALPIALPAPLVQGQPALNGAR